MKEFLLKKKWIGALFLFLFCFGSSAYWSNTIKNLGGELKEPVLTNASAFLPITFEGGMIEKPQNTRIEREYGEGADKIKIVLDTQTEEFEPSLLESGIYASRRAVYFVNSKKGEVRIQNYQNIPDMTVNEEMLAQTWQYAEEKMSSTLVGIICIGFLIWSFFVIGVVSLVTHLIMDAIYKSPYRQSLRISTYTYIAIMLINNVFSIHYVFWSVLLIAVLASIAVSTTDKKPETTE